MFGRNSDRDDFALVIYDTKLIAEIDARDTYEGYEKDYPPLAAKYALVLGNSLSGDIHIFSQSLRSSKYREEAVWFDTWANIDAVMGELRRRNPELTLIDKIGTFIDCPWMERTDDPIHLQVGDYRTRQPEWRLKAVRTD